MNKLETDLCSELLKQHLISEAGLNSDIEEAKKLNASLISYLIEHKRIPEDKLLPIISSLLQVPLINLKEIIIEEAAIKAVPVRFAWYYEFLPLKIEGNKLTIAVSSPLPIRVQDELRLNLRYEIAIVLARKEQIQELLKSRYGLGADTVDQMMARGGGSSLPEVAMPTYHKIEDIEKKAEDASVITLVNQIILDAHKKRSTDIHIEPFRGALRLRYRIDGVLYDQHVPEALNRFLVTIISRIKIMSNLDIVERRIPQDGRITVKTQEQMLDLRVSFIPTPHGESVVMRILPTKTFFSLESLGLSNRNLAIIESLINKPHGIIFVTGPTGSGKSTTLYACLKRIDKKEKKIITIEDPIEYEVEDVTQIQVNPEVGLTFAKGLRSMLRHDPDIMMVGEVRDQETAEIAIRVALTGHLIFSTLHTNDAVTGVTRLIDIGIEPYLVASSVEAFIAQRLIRTICPICKQKDSTAESSLKKEIARTLSLHSEQDVTIYSGKGCEKCNGTGFFGRTAIYEILLIDEAITKLISTKATASDIKRQAIANGMITLLQDGWLKVVSGLTTPAEVLNVCQGTELVGEGAAMEVPSTASLLNVPNTAAPEASAADRRIHARTSAKVSIRIRVIEKGEGEIIGLDATAGTSEGQHSIADLFQPAVTIADTAQAYKGLVVNTINISAGGLVFESRYLIPVGSIIELTIAITTYNRPMTCLARVVRVEKDLPRCFHIAVCYLDMTGVDRGRLNDFIEKELSQQPPGGSQTKA